ncbi:MAG: hypothetical protein AAGD96_22840, partial [Chloroflexota bacterium]
MKKVSGWLLQSYVNDAGGMALWLIDEHGERHQFDFALRVSFYAAGPFARLRQLWRWLKRESAHVSLAREQKEELHLGLIDVMSISCDVAEQQKLFNRVLHEFPDLDYYNADVIPSLYLAADHNLFPLAYCSLWVRHGRVMQIESLDDPWAVDYALPPLRMLFIEPACEPFHKPPSFIKVEADRKYQIDV